MTAGRRLVATVGLGVALVLGGCAEEQEGAAGAAAPPVGSGGGDAAHGADLRVGLTEWTIALARRSVHPGPLTLLVTNAGATEHDVVVRGRAGEWHSRELAPGEQQRLGVVARPGETLTLWCAEPGHEAQGMRTTLAVTGRVG